MTRKSPGDTRPVTGSNGTMPPPQVAAMLSTLSSPGNLDLLRIINQERPASVSQLAARTGRAQSNVSRSLRMLARHGLIRLQRDGKEVRPVGLARSLDVDLVAGTCRTFAARRARKRPSPRIGGGT